MSENSNTINNYGMHTISAPNLNSSEYATKLQQVFTNINDNFIKLANEDFIKGESGDSVEIITYNLNDSKNKDIKEKIKKCIISHFGPDNFTNDKGEIKISYKDNSGIKHEIGAFDSFDANPGSLQMICSKKINEQLETTYFPNSSLYYVFLDSRFANTNFGYINNIDEQYNDITDASCIVIYGLKNNAEGNKENDYEFKVLDNVFPTIYYESNTGLCWKINGNQTGIPVQGLPGKNGEDTKLFIVKADYNNKLTSEDTDTENTDAENTTFKAEITHIFDGAQGYLTTSEYLSQNSQDIQINRNYSAIIFKQKISSGNYEHSDYIYDFYFGNIKLEEEEILEENKKKKVYKIYATFDTANAINTTLQNEQVINAFKSINLANNKVGTLPGIFIPLQFKTTDDLKNTDVLPVHLLSATSIHNNPQSDTELNSDIIITPVNDINNLKIISSTESNESNTETDNTTETTTSGNIKVNKYMYLKVNKEKIDNLFTDINIEKEYYITNDNYDKGKKININNTTYDINIYEIKPSNSQNKYNECPFVEINNTRYLGKSVELDNAFFIINDKKYKVTKEDNSTKYYITIDNNKYEVTLKKGKRFNAAINGYYNYNYYEVTINNSVYKSVIFIISVPINTALTSKIAFTSGTTSVGQIKSTDGTLKDVTLIVDNDNNNYTLYKAKFDSTDNLFKNKDLIPDHQYRIDNGYIEIPTLYLELNNSYKTLYNNLKLFLESFNYTLKYKLIEDINSFESSVFNYFKPSPSENPLTNSSTLAMCIPVLTSDDSGTIDIDESNFVFAIDSKEPVKDNSGNDIYLTNFIHANDYINTSNGQDYFTEEFKDKFVNSYIYQWKLDLNYDAFDVQELLNCDAVEGTDNKNYRVNSKYYDILSCFKTVFTTTLSPDFDSNFMWFNGISLNKKQYTLKETTTTSTTDINGNTETTTVNKFIINTDTKYKGKWIIYGWDYNTSEIFSFYKFIPIFNNDFSIPNDTVFNINYNVNITGDDNLSTKDLSVNGNIKCEDLQVYSLSAAGEIKDIYTKDLIVGEDGILLGYQPGTNIQSAKANTYISNDGTVITNNIYSSILDSANINANTIKSNFVKVGTCTSIDVNNPNTQISSVDNIEYIDAGEIKAINTNKITLLRPKNLAATILPKTKAIGEEGFDNSTDLIKPINIGGNNIKIEGTEQIGSNNSNSDADFSNTNIDINNIFKPITDYSSWYIQPQDEIINKIAENQPCINTNISINSTGNAPIIVSNTTPDSQLLCMSGIASGYYDGKNTHPGYINSSITDDNNIFMALGYVQNTKFDDVKNFNIQRASVIKNIGTSITKNKNSIDIEKNTRSNLISSLKLGFRQCVHTKKFSERDSYWFSTSDSEFQNNEWLEKHNICKFIINSSTDLSEAKKNSEEPKTTIKFDDSNSITLKLNNLYNVLIGIDGETSYGSNPYLRSGSLIRLKLVVKTKGITDEDNVNVMTNICTKTLTSDIIYSGSAYKAANKKDVDDKITGETSITSSVIDISNSKHSSYDWGWRMRSFMFKTSDFTIAKNSEVFNKIKAAYDKNELIELFIVPEFYIHISSDKNKWGNYGDVFRGMLVTVPTPIKNDYSISNISALEHKNSTSGTYLDEDFKPTIEYSYYSIIPDASSEINSTTIAEDGIVHRTNDYVFGLGYSKAVIDHSKSGYNHAGKADGSFSETDDASWSGSDYKTNIPVLFYHTVEPKVDDTAGTYYKKSGDNILPNNESYNNKGFAQRIHAIPLEDIFNAIRYLRSTGTDLSQYGL